MKLVAASEEIDGALLAVGDDFSMRIVDASRAAESVHAQGAVPIHCNAFPYIEVDREELKALCSVPVEIFHSGETIQDYETRGLGAFGRALPSDCSRKRETSSNRFPNRSSSQWAAA